MATIPSAYAKYCPNCGQELGAGALVCPRCQALVYADDLNRLAAEAKQLEAGGQAGAAREVWLKALSLLPVDSPQTAQIREHVQVLSGQPTVAKAPKKDNKWAKRLGPLGPVAVLLAKAKSVLFVLLKFKFLLSFAAFIGLYWAMWGPKFGIGFAFLILIHEMGHLIDVKRRGLPAEMPVFLPGIGAYVRWQAMGVSLETRAAVSLAGPLAGFIASVACLAIWAKTGDPIWAALARAGAWLNVLNLIPVWVFDGGTAAWALGRVERLLVMGASLALGLILHETVFYVLAAGALYRLFTRDLPEHTSHMIAGYYLTLLVCLGLVLRMVPGQGFLPAR